jgi:hypothetical protein
VHTDEYEISIGREVTLCRKVIKRLCSALKEKEKRYGISTEAFLEEFLLGKLPEENHDFRQWKEEYQELGNWQQKLREYEEALQVLKGI